MSESRDNDDEQGKMMKDSDVQQEEEVSTEGNASSSTPLEETPTQTEGSADKMTEKPSGEGNVDLPFHKLTTHDDDDTISQSKSGGGSSSSERANQELQNTDDQFHREAIFFELQLTQNDVEKDSLCIPKKTAAEHFPCVPIDTVQGDIIDGKIVISDTQNQNWNMTLFYIHSLGAFLIAGGWHDFAVRHNLKARDVICFCRPLSHFGALNFLIQHVKPPEFKPGSFLFQQQMTSTSKSVLNLPKEEVRKHFPEIEIPDGRRLHFTDAQNMDWPMIISFAQNTDAYMLTDGWDGFVNKHGLEAMDVIRFYKPVQPLHEGHFLIECVKREEAASGTSSGQNDQLGWGDRASSGKHAGPSPHCGSPGKGRTRSCWTGNNKPGGRKRAIKALEEFLQATVGDWEAMVLISQLLDSKK
ncbi:unnamed protein product [Camellia sinensis]